MGLAMLRVGIALPFLFFVAVHVSLHPPMRTFTGIRDADTLFTTGATSPRPIQPHLTVLCAVFA
jgi:hypothetical protein